MTDSESDNDLFAHNRNAMDLQNQGTTICAKGPGVNVKLSGANFHANTSRMNIPWNTFRPRYAESVCDTQSMIYRRGGDHSISSQSVSSSKLKTGNLQTSYYPSNISSSQSLINGRCGSSMSVRTIDSNTSVTANDIAYAFRNGNFNKFDFKIIRDAYKSLMKGRARKRIEKKRNIRTFLKGFRRMSGGDSGDQASDSSISSDDCRSIQSSRTNFKENMSTYRSVTGNISSVKNTIMNNTNVKNYTASSTQHSNRITSSVSTDENIQKPAPDVFLFGQRDRFKSGFLLPSQRFNQSMSSNSYLEKTNRLPKINEDLCQVTNNEHMQKNQNTSVSEEEIFDTTVRENPNCSNNRKRHLDDDDCGPVNKIKKLSSPQKRLPTAHTAKATSHKSNDFIFAKPQLPVKRPIMVRNNPKNNVETLETQSKNCKNKKNENVSTKQNENVSTKQNENGSTKRNENGSTKQNENVSTKRNENVSIKRNENVSIKRNENASTKQNEKVSTKRNENVSTKRNENASTKQNENVSTKQNENVSTKQNQNVSTKRNENVSTKQNENVSTKRNENLSTKQNENVSTKAQLELTQQSDDMSMRPSFIKRKLFSQKIVLAEKNSSSDSLQADSPQTNIYSSMQKEKNRARKLGTQSCLSRDVLGDESNLLDLIHRVVPANQMNVTNKLESTKYAKTANGNTRDVSSVLATTCNDEELSDTYTDEEIFSSTFLSQKNTAQDSSTILSQKNTGQDSSTILSQKNTGQDSSTILSQTNTGQDPVVVVNKPQPSNNKRPHTKDEPKSMNIKTTKIVPKATGRTKDLKTVQLQKREQNVELEEIKDLQKKVYTAVKSFWDTDVESEIETTSTTHFGNSKQGTSVPKDAINSTHNVQRNITHSLHLKKTVSNANSSKTIKTTKEITVTSKANGRTESKNKINNKNKTLNNKSIPLNTTLRAQRKPKVIRCCEESSKLDHTFENSAKVIRRCEESPKLDNTFENSGETSYRSLRSREVDVSNGNMNLPKKKTTQKKTNTKLNTSSVSSNGDTPFTLQSKSNHNTSTNNKKNAREKSPVVRKTRQSDVSFSLSPGNKSVTPRKSARIKKLDSLYKNFTPPNTHGIPANFAGGSRLRTSVRLNRSKLLI